MRSVVLSEDERTDWKARARLCRMLSGGSLRPILLVGQVPHQTLPSNAASNIPSVFNRRFVPFAGFTRGGTRKWQRACALLVPFHHWYDAAYVYTCHPTRHLQHSRCVAQARTVIDAFPTMCHTCPPHVYAHFYTNLLNTRHPQVTTSVCSARCRSLLVPCRMSAHATRMRTDMPIPVRMRMSKHMLPRPMAARSVSAPRLRRPT